MGSKQAAEIQKTLEQWRQNVDSGMEDTIATFELSTDRGKWVQIVQDSINIAFPFSDDPQKRIANCGMRDTSRWKLIDWDAGSFANFECNTSSVFQTCDLIDEVFLKLFGCADDYVVNGKIE